MVEFGLKLNDNKTAKWSHHYLDYEKLKRMLKKAKKAREAKVRKSEHSVLATRTAPRPYLEIRSLEVYFANVSIFCARETKRRCNGAA